MRHKLLVVLLLAALPSFAQQPFQPQQSSQSNQPPSKGCIAVKSIGSHAFRNIMLAGVAGALISKQQYQVVDAAAYPAQIGQKFHGDTLQALGSSGTRVVILDKKYTAADLNNACQ
jgi:hypothetical protein